MVTVKATLLYDSPVSGSGKFARTCLNKHQPQNIFNTNFFENEIFFNEKFSDYGISSQPIAYTDIMYMYMYTCTTTSELLYM